MVHTQQSQSLPRVLIVDDEPLTRRALGRLVPREEFTVSFAEDGESALASMMTGSFDVVVADVQMPGLNGVDMLRHVRDHDKQLPVIFVTGSPSVNMAAQAVELGAFRYLVKPVRREMMQAVLRSALKKRVETNADRRASLNAAGHVAPSSDSSTKAWFELFVVLGQGCRRMTLTPLADGSIKPFVQLTPRALADYCNAQPPWLSRVVVEVSAAAGVFGDAQLRHHWDELRRHHIPLAVADYDGDIVHLTELGSLRPNFVVLNESLLSAIDSEPAQREAVVRVVEVCRLMDATVVVPCIANPAAVATLQQLGCNVFQSYLVRRSGAVDGG